MTPSGVLRAIGQLLGAVVLVVSGAYLLVYLYRWEWNRAIVSGIFFLAALITLSTMLVLRAVRQATDHLDRLSARAAREDATRTILGQVNADHARRHFAWLEGRHSRLSVFIPVLLGAGAMLSGVTYLLERTASAIAGATIDRRTARLLAPDLPLGPPRAMPRSTFAPTPDRPRDPLLRSAAVPPPPTRSTRIRQLVTGVAVVVVLGLTAMALRELTETRPEPGTAEGSTALVLEIEQKRTPRPVEGVAEALWIACRSRLQRTTELNEAEALDEDTVRIVVSQGMGPLRERRFVGCLQDATLDLVRARVVGTEQLE
jgi:hypothetical protein